MGIFLLSLNDIEMYHFDVLYHELLQKSIGNICSVIITYPLLYFCSVMKIPTSKVGKCITRLPRLLLNHSQCARSS